MSASATSQWSHELEAAIVHAVAAHNKHANSPDDAVRFHDRKTPYVVHPIWCATSLLSEPALPEELRRNGAIALLWHDTLEDTRLPLPSWSSEKVSSLVAEMTFESFQQEIDHLWERSEEAKLLKLYDKVSNLLDGSWMKTPKWNAYIVHTLKLAEHVQSRWGILNIVRIAHTLCIPRQETA
ncbi:MAG: hypothetical protein P4L83_03235 [Nevskia sp.]|nr:hypothetical protein [Nevskia sp.]